MEGESKFQSIFRKRPRPADAAADEESPDKRPKEGETSVVDTVAVNATPPRPTSSTVADAAATAAAKQKASDKGKDAKNGDKNDDDDDDDNAMALPTVQRKKIGVPQVQPSPVATSPLRRPSPRTGVVPFPVPEADDEDKETAPKAPPKPSLRTKTVTLWKAVLVMVVIIAALLEAHVQTWQQWEDEKTQITARMWTATERVRQELQAGHQHQVKVLQESRDAMQKEIDMYKLRLGQGADPEELQREVLRLQAHKDEMLTILEKKEKDHAKERALLQARLESSEKGRNAASKHLQEMHNQAIQDIDALREQVEELETERNEAVASAERAHVELEDLWTKAQGLEKNRDDWEALAKRFELEIVPDLEARLVQAHERAGVLEQELAQQSDELRQIHSIAVNLENQNKELIKARDGEQAQAAEL